MRTFVITVIDEEPGRAKYASFAEAAFCCCITPNSAKSQTQLELAVVRPGAKDRTLIFSR